VLAIDSEEMRVREKLFYISVFPGFLICTK